MQRITVFSEKFVKIIILLIKRSYIIGDVRAYYTALKPDRIKAMDQPDHVTNFL